jgi:hypothetical protein
MADKDDRARLAESISTFTKELEWAEAKLKESTEDRLRAHAVEDQWQSEVNSLRKLIEVRKARLSPKPHGQSVVAGISAIEEGPVSPDTNRVAWVYEQIVASGTHGMTPPDIYRAAKKVGLSMHKNYPYVVLRKLIERDKVTKKGERYHKKES